jgi:lipid A disaccharide synthetase
MVEDIEELKKEKEQKLVSLQEEKRKKERETAEKQKQIRKEQREESEKINGKQDADALIMESGNILLDLKLLALNN